MLGRSDKMWPIIQSQRGRPRQYRETSDYTNLSWLNLCLKTVGGSCEKLCLHAQRQKRWAVCIVPSSAATLAWRRNEDTDRWTFSPRGRSRQYCLLHAWLASGESSVWSCAPALGQSPPFPHWPLWHNSVPCNSNTPSVAHFIVKRVLPENTHLYCWSLDDRFHFCVPTQLP